MTRPTDTECPGCHYRQGQIDGLEAKLKTQTEMVDNWVKSYNTLAAAHRRVVNELEEHRELAKRIREILPDETNT